MYQSPKKNYAGSWLIHFIHTYHSMVVWDFVILWKRDSAVPDKASHTTLSPEVVLLNNRRD
jgi:hypothetical protein